MTAASVRIQSRLTALGTEKKARWLEGYVKHGIRSKGVGTPQIRSVVQEVEREERLREGPWRQQVEVLNDLMVQPYSEDKLAAVLYLQLFHGASRVDRQLRLVSGWFDHDWIHDWNVCDWLCVRILTPLLDREPEAVVPTLREWNQAPALWKARASLVPFAQSRQLVQHTGVVHELATVLIARPERFAKTAVGWVLRELSRHDPEWVLDFLARHEGATTREVVHNATKYL